MPTPLLSDVQVHPIDSADLYRAATRLYTRVFGYTDRDLGLNANLLSAVSKNGGSTVAAFDGTGEMVGFAYGFAGTDDTGAQFHYSQAAVVDPAFQGQGVGRRLKHAQREIALRWGQTHMRWTFDPRLTRNAHFNLRTLRGEGIRYERDYYDRPGTDRLLVDWDLTREEDPYAPLRTAQPPADLAGAAGTTVDADIDGAVWIPLPRTGADPLRSRVRDGLRRALTGRILVACVPVDDTTSAYLAVPAPGSGRG